jgi:hypothetical protein
MEDEHKKASVRRSKTLGNVSGCSHSNDTKRDKRSKTVHDCSQGATRRRSSKSSKTTRAVSHIDRLLMKRAVLVSNIDKLAAERDRLEASVDALILEYELDDPSSHELALLRSEKEYLTLLRERAIKERRELDAVQTHLESERDRVLQQTAKKDVPTPEKNTVKAACPKKRETEKLPRKSQNMTKSLPDMGALHAAMDDMHLTGMAQMGLDPTSLQQLQTHYKQTKCKAVSS